ncbi:hypothetical protein DMC25_14665 [Caulobacter sp. D4A]|uniref:hypothetical protein n=1 Tax=unclassified Caulobacter TaxID=2648921 RepID=UPI000D73CCCD|nr:MULTISPECIES: hypothetical protein [unclassified Caulobacter]PXA85909.1 hypothetical protein DMC25_14665 [Caulobacter sp. D4A]PXA90534.1 hypothetical protein DMC18_14490 [Caulobacter sp. D5]
MSETLAEGGSRISPGRRIVILVWAMILTLVPCIAGLAVLATRDIAGGFTAHLAPPSIWFDFALGQEPLAALAAILVALGTYVLLVRLGEKRWPSELAPAFAILELGLGIVLAALAFGLLMGVLTLSGGVVWRPPTSIDWYAALANGLPQGLFGGLLLGLAVQGGTARLATQALGPVAGVVLAALLASWLVSSGWKLPPIQRVNATLGGAILGLLWLRRQRLWLGLGLSTAWGALSGAVIGGPALFCAEDTSIYEPGRGILIAWLRGTDGPEGSIPLLIGCVFAVGWLTWRAWKEGRFSKA